MRIKVVSYELPAVYNVEQSGDCNSATSDFTHYPDLTSPNSFYRPHTHTHTHTQTYFGDSFLESRYLFFRILSSDIHRQHHTCRPPPPTHTHTHTHIHLPPSLNLFKYSCQSIFRSIPGAPLLSPSHRPINFLSASFG